jgi:hypothetical protein
VLPARKARDAVIHRPGSRSHTDFKAGRRPFSPPAAARFAPNGAVDGGGGIRTHGPG